MLGNFFKVLGYDFRRAAPEWAALHDIEAPETIIDVGAANGTPILYQTFPAANLLLVEPLPVFHDALQKLLSTRNGTLFPVAAGATAEEVTITCETSDPTKSSVLTRTNLTQVSGAKEQIAVSVRPLDSILEGVTLGANCLLKIDTEGYELEVLRGAVETLPKCRYVIAEASVMQRFEESYDLMDLLLFMREHRFQVRHILSAPKDRTGRIRMMDILFEKSDG